MYEHAIAPRIEQLHTESAFQILARANDLESAGRSIIHCEIGQPDFNTPQNIIEAGCAAMRNGYTGYTPTAGYPQVRQTIADYIRAHKNVPAEKENIVVVPGGKPIMFFTMLLLVEPGDEVIYPNPGFPIYESCIRFAGGKPVPMPLLAEHDFRPDWDSFEDLITEKTKLIIVNSPSNPTGGVFPEADIRKLADILRRYPDIYILSDEIYDRLIFEGSAFSIASLPGFQDRTIILDGFSKTYAMTGWRIGYGVMNPEFAEKIELLMVNSNSCAAAFTQMAAMEALTGPQDSVDDMREAFRKRSEYLTGALNGIDGITCRRPMGAFYTFPDISSFGIPDKEFCTRLLDEYGVAASWGTAFGQYGKGFMRLSCATSMENLEIAVERIAAFTKSL